MTSVQIFKKEVPPLSVRALHGELNTLSSLIDDWSSCDRPQLREQLTRKIRESMHPDLVKALVMIARKETSAILKNREKVRLCYLGRVRLFGVTERHFMQWIDVLVTEDGTPFLRRVSLSEDGMEFYAFTWAGCTSLTCADTERWDEGRKIWLWDSAGTEEVTAMRRDGVLPYLPLEMSRYDQFEVYDWERHLIFPTFNELLEAVDRVGKGHMDAIERDCVLRLLMGVQADMNPLLPDFSRSV
jgi:hypothetical protein